MRASIEVADIFRAAGPAYRAAHAGHLSLAQLKVMSAIEYCRTAALGGHVEACEDCGQLRIAYNSCRNRHCPKCQGAAARTWLAEREADLLPVGYFHVVFTLPAEVADIAFQNKALVYDLLFKAASETMLTIAADPKHLGARIGITAVLHTWGSAMTHHPHVHMIVPGGGIAPDESRWISSRPAFLLPVRVLGKLFRRLFLTRLVALHDAGRLGFFGTLAHLIERRTFLRHLAPVRGKRWVVYAKAPFAGPGAVLAYLSRYTHRVAISNSRLMTFDETGVSFRYKDYRRDGADRQQVMTLAADEFIRRLLLHMLPRGIRVSDATVSRTLKRNGVNRLPRGTRLRKVHTKRYNKQVPGHHIQMDVKFLTFKGKRGEKIRRFQFTAIDDATRVRALKIYAKHTQASAIDFVDHIIETFPFRIREFRTDNGHEFQAKFHWHVEDKGIRHAYIKRGTPQLNGKVERSHRSDQQEFYQLLTYKGDVDLEKRLDEWERFYNFARPHGAFNGKTPYEALREKL